MIPMAGDILTEHLTGTHLVDFSTAEKIKLESNTKKKSISYKDIMGLSQKTTPTDVWEELRPVVENMTKQVAEKIKELNDVRGEEEKLETQIKENYKLDSFIKIKDNQIQVTINSSEHSESLANNIMRTIQSNYDGSKYITVKFQK